MSSDIDVTLAFYRASSLKSLKIKLVFQEAGALIFTLAIQIHNYLTKINAESSSLSANKAGVRSGNKQAGK